MPIHVSLFQLTVDFKPYFYVVSWKFILKFNEEFQPNLLQLIKKFNYNICVKFKMKPEKFEFLVCVIQVIIPIICGWLLLIYDLHF